MYKKNFEIIFVDDGSTDDSFSKLFLLSKENKSIHLEKFLDFPEEFNNEELNTKLNEMIASRSYDIVANTDLSDNNINDNVPIPKKETNDQKKVSFLPTSESILSKLKPLEKIEDFSDKKEEFLSDLSSQREFWQKKIQ